MKPQFRFKPGAATVWHLVPVGSPVCTSKIPSEPKKSPIYNKITPDVDPNEPKEPNPVIHPTQIPNEPIDPLKINT